MATDLGLELAEIAGSGPNGRIVRQDIERRAAQPGRSWCGWGAPAPSRPLGPVLAAPACTASPTGPEFTDEPLTSMRKVIATRLVQSKAPVPHFYLTIEVNMQRAKELRESVTPARSRSEDQLQRHYFEGLRGGIAAESGSECLVPGRDDSQLTIASIWESRWRRMAAD